MKAAQLYEEHLRDPFRAAELYEQVANDYPQSRLARRAEVRARILRKGMGEGSEHRAALAQYHGILRGFADRPVMESIEAVEALLTESPDFPLAAEATLLLVTTYQREGRLDEALDWAAVLEERFPDSDQALQGRRRKGDILLARGEFDLAESEYQRLARDNPAGAKWLETALAELERQRRRVRAARWAWVVVAAALLFLLALIRRDAGSNRTFTRALSHPPPEVIYLIPVIGTLVVVSQVSNALVANAVVFIGVGALAITWLVGCGTLLAKARGRLSWQRTVVVVLTTTAAVAAICYLALMQELLLDMIVETVKFGPELSH